MDITGTGTAETADTSLRLMLVYAHVADSACEAAGTAALHVARGDHVTTVICTNGERHHPDLFLATDEAPGRTRETEAVRASAGDVRGIKQREAEAVARIVGVHDLVLLDWPDDHLEITAERIDQLAAQILRVRPHIIVTHLPVHARAAVDPHAHVGQLVLLARDVAASRIRQLDGVAAHHVKEIFYFPMGGEIADSRDPLCGGIVCDVWIDITAVVATKVRAMDQIVSQGYHGATARKIVESREGRWGMLAGVSYAEPFLRSSGRTYDSLPMPPRLLAQPFTPNNLPGDQLLAHRVPLATTAAPERGDASRGGPA
ncbi:MAG TPA: PIG-L family deacetylase [Thermomicrobiaceae bacterium]|nr:PIG-L family deacetylase [Thermomicrobiaceae bacterium]